MRGQQVPFAIEFAHQCHVTVPRSPLHTHKPCASPPPPPVTPTTRYSSAIEFSHQRHVTDLLWMPGIECHKGRFTKLGEGSKECNFFATTAGDGKVRHSSIPLL